MLRRRPVAGVLSGRVGTDAPGLHCAGHAADGEGALGTPVLESTFSHATLTDLSPDRGNALRTRPITALPRVHPTPSGTPRRSVRPGCLRR